MGRGQGQPSNMTIAQRSDAWLNTKNKKIESERDRKKGQETEGCTFEPKLHQYKPPRHDSKANTMIKTNGSINQTINNSTGMIKQGKPLSGRAASTSSPSYSQIYEKRQSVRSRS